jgi:hypothetical protein
MFIVPMAAPTMHEPPHCAEQPNVTVQRAVAGTVMRIDSVGSGCVNDKKVTHQGSPPIVVPVLLLFAVSTLERHQEDERYGTETVIYCHICHRECDSFLRRDFLRPH